MEDNDLERAEKRLDLGLATVHEIIALAGEHPELEKTRLVKLIQLLLLAARKKDGNAIPDLQRYGLIRLAPPSNRQGSNRVKRPCSAPLSSRLTSWTA